MTHSLLVITRGLPGSGKTTWATRWVTELPYHRIRVNRDCLRDVLWPGCFDRMPEQEAAVKIVQMTSVAALLVEGWDVVVDDTCLDSATLDRWRDLVGRLDAQLRVIDLRDVPVGVCVDRDARRPRHTTSGRRDGARVGAGVIRGMAERWLTTTEEMTGD